MAKVAAIQMCSSNMVEENLATASSLIAAAAQKNAALLVLPEMFPIIESTSSEKIKIAEEFGNGKIQGFLAEQALRHRVWIVGGTIPIRSKNSTKIRAACLVYDDHGRCVARYDKIHLFDVTLSQTETYQESTETEHGHELVVIDTAVSRLGLAVCYDIRFPGLFTHLFNQGAEMIAIPAAFTVKTGTAHWQVLARSRAIENFCYVVGACQGGKHVSGRETYGHSLIVDPWGRVLAELTTAGPGIIYAEIDLTELHKIRAAIPIAEHQKIKPDLSGLK